MDFPLLPILSWNNSVATVGHEQPRGTGFLKGGGDCKQTLSAICVLLHLNLMLLHIRILKMLQDILSSLHLLKQMMFMSVCRLPVPSRAQTRQRHGDILSVSVNGESTTDKGLHFSNPVILKILVGYSWDFWVEELSLNCSLIPTTAVRSIYGTTLWGAVRASLCLMLILEPLLQGRVQCMSANSSF